MTFEEHVQQRLEKGAREYGDKSWSRPVEELLDEMLEEFADVGGWGGIVQTKLNLDDPTQVSLFEYALAKAQMGYDLLRALKDHMAPKDPYTQGIADSIGLEPSVVEAELHFDCSPTPFGESTRRMAEYVFSQEPGEPLA